MSKTLSASENTSPVPLVRLSDNSPNRQDDSPSSPSEPKEIISPALAFQPDTTPPSELNGWSEDRPIAPDLSQRLPHDGHFLDSAAATPRLPPSKHGSDDLHIMPSHELGMLDDDPVPFTSSLPEPLSSNHARPSLSPLSPKASLVTSFSEINLNTASGFRDALQHGLHSGDKGTAKDHINPSAKPSRYPAGHTATSLLYAARTRSQGAMTDAQIYKVLEEGPTKQDDAIDGRERSAQPNGGTGTEEKRNRSSSRSGRVEKRIEATLAKAEPSSTARSRKSSHLLGLFKEKVPSPLAKDFRAGEYQLKERFASQDDGHSHERRDSVVQSSRQQDHQRLEQSVSGQKEHDNDERTESELYPRPLKDPIREIPPDLLSEIRDHKLAIPTGSNAGLRKSQAPHRATPLGSKPPGDSDETDLSRFSEGEVLGGHEQLESTFEGEGEDDSDKEEISSALYYPHEAPSPGAFDDPKDVPPAPSTNSGQQEFRLPAQRQTTPEHDNETPSEEVDIALQSQNKQRYLHGDIPKASGLLDDALGFDSWVSSASESEYESQDESGRSISGDEGHVTAASEMTPRASPGTVSSFLQSRFKKRLGRPTAPFGAVELKPYTHQVGGHSTVYKFSKRAVCKPLSNRENEFYEVIEHQHPELLKFLPRYEIYFLKSSFPSVKS